MLDPALLAKQNIRIQKYVTIIAIILFAVKFYAWYLTNSVAIYTDALESVVNIVSGFLGLYSLYFAARPRDASHPYGHGKIEFVSAAIEGAFITLAGIIILFRVADVTNDNHELAQLDWGIGLIVITALINYMAGFISIRIGKKNNSIALIASGKHLQTDTYSTIGIIIGLGLVMATGLNWIDGAVALVFAILIMVSGVKILRQAIAGIMDEADPSLIEEVVEYLEQNRRENWIDLHNLRIIKYGSILHFDAHMTVPGHLTVREAHNELKQIEAIMERKYGKRVEMFIHLDPCAENYSPETHPRIRWTVANVTQRHQHFPQ